MKRKSSPERRKKFRVWPQPKDGKPYGPSVKQHFLFLEHIRQDEERLNQDLVKHLKKYNYNEQQIAIQMAAVKTHQHGQDIFLFDGAARGGKTAAATARVIQYLLENPGSTAVVGAENFPLLQRSAYEEWRKRFTIFENWDHPFISKAPTQHEKRLILKNGSQVWFLHFNDYKILRGLEADIIHIEEAALLPSEDSMNELLRRLSGKKGPIRQLILTTNPEEDHNWIYEKFSLKQFEMDYAGEPMPIGRLCTCQLCHECMILEKSNEYDSQGFCPECGNKKDTDCPGNQQFFRVLRIASYENDHLPSDYAETQKAATSENYYNLYIKGGVGELREGRVYKRFSKSKNILEHHIPLDYDKPLFWSFDFNVSYQCSVICQEVETEQGVFVYVVDEIVLPECGPEHVAEEFLRRFPNFNNKILIYGDPAALNRKVSSNDVSQFQTIYDIITDPKGKLGLDLVPKDVEIMVKKIKGNTRVPVTGKVDSTNEMLTSFDGISRILINKKCEYLIESLTKVKWKLTDGKPVIDDRVDRNAMASANKFSVKPLTHICDALGYLIYKRHPVVGDAKDIAFMQMTGDRVIELRGEDVVEYTPWNSPDDKDELDSEPESFLDWLDSIKNPWDDPDTGIFRTFW